MAFLKSITPKKWLTIAVLNFLIVGLLGLMMRLKMIIPMPWMHQKFFLHAHSHFAFSGWVTHALMVLLLVGVLKTVQSTSNSRDLWKGNLLIMANLVTSYGMLVSFVLQGYGRYSITFATLSIFVSYFFAAYVWKRCAQWARTKDQMLVCNWFKGALVFFVLSSLGTFALSYLMMIRSVDTHKQLASVYFYLHFQYNGWFLFACLGLFHHWLQTRGIYLKRAKVLLYTFAGACIPTYFLSVLWWKNMPDWVYGLVVIASIAQLIVWFVWLVELWKKKALLRPHSTLMVRFLLLVVGVSFSIKLVLQALSLIPELSQFAYGFRPIVIGYLHLVLLVIISLFIMALLFMNNCLQENLIVRAGVIMTVFGILFNEVVLMLQGLAGMLRIFIHHTHQMLVVASAIICFGLIVVLLGQLRRPLERGRDS